MAPLNVSYRAPGDHHLQNGKDFTATSHRDTYDYVNPEQFNLTGRSVLVTGASRGIGRETALSFARAGTSFIAIAARSPLDTLKQEMLAAAEKAGKGKPDIIELQIDVSDYASVEAAANKMTSAFGRLDIIINNAGHAESWVRMFEMQPDQWTRTWQINVFGVYYVSRAFFPLLQAKSDSWKQIINITSIGATLLGPGGSAYKPGKLAVSRFSEYIGSEYPDVLSYSVHPGGVWTELSSGLAVGMGEAAARSLLGDTPQLAADSLVWLTAERRDWLAGRYVSVNWDMREFLEKQKEIEEQDLLFFRLRVG